MKKVTGIFLIAFLFFRVALAFSAEFKKDTVQLEQKKFDAKNLNSYKKNSDFNYTEKIDATEPSVIETLLDWLWRQFLKLIEWIAGVENAEGIAKTILKILPYIIAGIALFLLLKFFMKIQSTGILQSKNSSVVEISKEEELVKHANLPELILKAIQNKNYRLAVRYSFLHVLKNLEEKKFISWELQKTNTEYLSEIASQDIKSKVEELTHLYEFVWYGNFSISESEFAKVQLQYETVLSSLKRK